MKPFVKVIRGQEPCRAAYEAIQAVCTYPVQGKKILLKPNTGFDGPAMSGLCTHPEIIRGLIRFFQEQGAAEILVGDSSVIGVDSVQALKSAGIWEVCQQEGVRCMDLNDSPPVEMRIRDSHVVDSLLLSSVIYEVDLVVSVPVMKTHMYTGATLGIKNMKGAMYKREKNKLHRLTRPAPAGATERALDYGILDLTTVCYPHITVVDGIVGGEGFGPSGGTPRPFGVVVASENPAACDMVALRLMGLSLSEVGHVKLVAQREGLTYDNIRVEPADYQQYAVQFLTAAQAKLNLSCKGLVYRDESACSACHATLTQLLRYHADKFDQDEPAYLFAGKDLREEEILARGDKAFLIGNCTARFRELAPFCKGCPPVTSEILKLVKGMTGVTVNYLGHSAFNLTTKDYRIVIDPYLSGNPLAATKWEELAATHLCVTHAHDDHLGDTAAIAKATGAPVYCIPELARHFLSTLPTVTGNLGGTLKTEFGWVKFIPALHSSGVEGGIACGFLLEIEGIKIYHAGDTALTNDMALLAREKIDIALLPIGGTYTMGIEDAVTAVELICPKVAIPMHYNTFLSIQQDPLLFKELVEARTDTCVELLAPGEHFLYNNQKGPVVANATWEGGVL